MTQKTKESGDDLAIDVNRLVRSCRGYTADRAKLIYGQDMKPCPKCGSFHFQYQTPIKMKTTGKEMARQLLGKYARATKAGAIVLEGPVFIMCFECGHKGPAMDCSGRTSEDVGKDRYVSDTVKRLWNNQSNVEVSRHGESNED